MPDRPVAIIGDIHGESTKLRKLIAAIREQFGEVDLYAVGDILDRGPDPKGALQTCIDEDVKGVLGNHELWMGRYLTTGKFDGEALHWMMGGAATLASYGLHYKDTQIPRIEHGLGRAMPQEHKDYILNLPLIREVVVAGTSYLITHAGVKGGMTIQVQQAHAMQGGEPLSEDELLALVCEEQPDSLLWQHIEKNQPDVYRFDGTVQVFGHTVLTEHIDGGYFYAIDTGCGKKKPPNRLTAVVLLPEGGKQFLSVP